VIDVNLGQLTLKQVIHEERAVAAKKKVRTVHTDPSLTRSAGCGFLQPSLLFTSAALKLNPQVDTALAEVTPLLIA